MRASRADVEPRAETLTSQLYDRLRGDIISGALKPGTKLKVEHLRTLYNTGASAVREALSLLTSDGLVQRLENRGFRVARASNDDFQDLLNTRCWIEERALREAMAHGGAEWEDAIVLSHYRLSREPRAAGKRRGFVTNPEWEVLHRKFHMALTAACGSPILIGYCEDLYDKNVRYRNLAAPSAYPARDINAEHEAIMKAVLDRKADAAVALLTAHYRNTGAYLEIW